MEIEVINLAFQQVFYPEIGIAKLENESEDEFFKINDFTLTFNLFSNKEVYNDFVWFLIEDIEKEIKNNIKGASSRLKALYYIKQLKLNIKKYARSFHTVKDNGLDELNQVMYEHLKNSDKKLPKEFQDLNKVKLNINRNVTYSEELEELLLTEPNQNLIDSFQSSFVSAQIAMVEELEMMIDTFESFVENVTVEDFKNKDEFFELDFKTITLSDSVKLTDKEVNKKIDTLDIRQTALLFDYFEKAKLILPYNNKDKASFAHYLTGHAKDKIRTEKGFGMIKYIREDVIKPEKYRDVEFYNLKGVRNELNRVVRMINADIEKLSKNEKNQNK